MARLPYRERSDLPEAQRRLFDELQAERGYIANLYRAMANAPAMMADFVRSTATMRRRGALPARLKELAILAVARSTSAENMWASHLPLARAAGLDADVAPPHRFALREDLLPEHEQAVVAYAEEASEYVRVTDATWGALKAFLDDEQLTELVFIVAFYNMVARFLEPARVELDPEYTRELERLG
jgi:4-carboxymuconolactone decarboxylase